MDEVEIDDDHPHLGALQFVSKLSPNGALPLAIGPVMTITMR
jgi:hypothetical protein